MATRALPAADSSRVATSGRRRVGMPSTEPSGSGVELAGAQHVGGTGRLRRHEPIAQVQLAAEARGRPVFARAGHRDRRRW